MRKFFTVALAVMAILFSAQFVQAADGTNDEELGQPAVPIESSKVYPKDIEKGLKYNGTVVISATVSTEGKVIKTVVMRSAGRAKIDKVAMEAAAKWQFKPAVDKHGNPIENWYMIKFEPKDF